MKKFVRDILLFCIPVFALVLAYIATDIFRVVRHYDPHYTGHYCVETNRAYGSTMTYINQNPSRHYDSFIFGNSQSLNYRIDSWKHHLPEGCRCMHFDEFGGSIGGVHDKIAYIDKSGGKLRNVLLVVDDVLLSRLEQTQGYLFVEPPILKGYRNLVDFHVQHFEAFLNLKFLTAWADYRLTGKIRPYMGHLIRDVQLTYIPETNEIQETPADLAIEAGTYYDEQHVKVFEGVQRPGTFSTEHLDEKALELLTDIRRIFDKHHKNYKIVVSPQYHQVKLNRDSYQRLCQIFGESHVYDFSGVNKWNQDYHYYYETAHYRPIVADEIMDIIYRQE